MNDHYHLELLSLQPKSNQSNKSNKNGKKKQKTKKTNKQKTMLCIHKNAQCKKLMTACQ